MREYDRLFIGGDWVAPAGSELLTVVSPYTERPVGRVPAGSAADIYRAVAAARQAFDLGPWPRMSLDERRAVLERAGAAIAPLAAALDELVTTENGVPLRFHQGSLASRFEYFTGLDLALEEVRTAPNGDQALVVHEPVGVVAAIVPWNSPLFLAVAKVIPALLAGCTVVLKPAPETPMSPYPLADAFREAGLPGGALNIVAADREVSELLVRHPGVDCVSFTGSTAVGKMIGAACGAQIKRVGLELGGKSAAILLDDVDVATAVPAVLNGGMFSINGQACVAWTRILVPRRRHDEIVEAMRETVREAKIGDPLDPATLLGPLVAARQRDRVEGYIALGVSEGARIAVGGGRPPGQPTGWFVEPTVLAGADNSMRVCREEIFGPVIAVIPHDGDDDAVRIANDSSYGLAAGVFSADDERALRVARRIRAGTVGVKSSGLSVAFPNGGFKESGFGRQYGPEGVFEFLETKAIGLPPGLGASLLAAAL
jgi:aldehyde dehydrogenase (NAD+)